MPCAMTGVDEEALNDLASTKHASKIETRNIHVKGIVHQLMWAVVFSQARC